MSETKRVALVTGAGGGIGVATVRAFTEAGYRIAAVDRNAEGLKRATGGVAEGEIATWVGDLADLAFCEQMVREAAERFGRLDVLVNNAAIHGMTTMRTTTIEEWEEVLRVNLTAPAFLARWAAAVMEANGGGVVVNISSIEAAVPKSLCPAYIAAKAGIDGLTYNLANLYGPAGIRVVSLQPGAIDTDLSNDYVDAEGENTSRMLREATEARTPLGRWGTAEEIAATIVWLASDAASYMTGTVIRADGGLTRNLVPYAALGKLADGRG